MMDGASSEASGACVTIVSADPFRCRMWGLHDRLDESISEGSCREEIESFQRHGQLVAVLGRRIREPGIDYELIYGARRLFVARHIRCPIRIRVCEIGDRDALIAMDIENRQRRDISPYERGLNYARWLRTGLFASQEEIAKALDISASQVSRLLKFARLPSVVIGAFASPLDIHENWGLDLAEAWSDPCKRESLARAAREVIKGKKGGTSSKDVFKRLMSAATKHREKTSAFGEVFRDRSGRPLFRLKRLTTAVIISLPLQTVNTESLEEITRSISAILEGSEKNGMSSTGSSAGRSYNEIVSASPTTHSALSLHDASLANP